MVWTLGEHGWTTIPTCAIVGWIESRINKSQHVLGRRKTPKRVPPFPPSPAAHRRAVRSALPSSCRGWLRHQRPAARRVPAGQVLPGVWCENKDGQRDKINQYHSNHSNITRPLWRVISEDAQSLPMLPRGPLSQKCSKVENMFETPQSAQNWMKFIMCQTPNPSHSPERSLGGKVGSCSRWKSSSSFTWHLRRRMWWVDLQGWCLPAMFGLV